MEIMKQLRGNLRHSTERSRQFATHLDKAAEAFEQIAEAAARSAYELREFAYAYRAAEEAASREGSQ